MSAQLLSGALSVYGTRNDALTARYLELGQLFDRKQWHQLTEKLEELVHDQSMWLDRNLLDLYRDFIEKIETKLNSLRLVLFVETAAKQHFTGEAYEPASAQELNTALEFMENVAKKSFLSDEAKFVAKMKIADYLIALGRDAEGKKLLDEVKAKFSALEGSSYESVVKSSYYRAESSYYRKLGPAGGKSSLFIEKFRMMTNNGNTAFHDAMMQYLAHTPFNGFPPEKRLSLALDVVTAALVAEEVFNFGDVLRYEVVQELGNSPSHKWLLDLLVIFNDGDVRKFNSLLDSHRAAFQASPTLVANIEILKQKVALLSLVRLVFDRPAEQRNIMFADIAKAALLPVEEVEWLVMRAFSKKLLRGTVDEVDQIVHITWLMPRILDASQTKVLSDKLSAWSKNVEAALLLELQAPELFATT